LKQPVRVGSVFQIVRMIRKQERRNVYVEVVLEEDQCPTVNRR
jgi:hypothetical protein